MSKAVPKSKARLNSAQHNLKRNQHDPLEAPRADGSRHERVKSLMADEGRRQSSQREADPPRTRQASDAMIEIGTRSDGAALKAASSRCQTRDQARSSARISDGDSSASLPLCASTAPCSKSGRQGSKREKAPRQTSSTAGPLRPAAVGQESGDIVRRRKSRSTHAGPSERRSAAERAAAAAEGRAASSAASGVEQRLTRASEALVRSLSSDDLLAAALDPVALFQDGGTISPQAFHENQMMPPGFALESIPHDHAEQLAMMQLFAMMQSIEEQRVEEQIFQTVLAESTEAVLQTTLERSMVEQEQPSTVPPAKDGWTEALPKAVVTKEDLLDETTSQCPICLDKYTAGSRATRMLCGHLFCTPCICSWLCNANSCPVCRYELPTDNAGFEKGRADRMQGRKSCLKEGELRMMPLVDLLQLMAVLSIPSDGCTDKMDLMTRLEVHPAVQIVSDRSDICYDQSDLTNLNISAMQALIERHQITIPQGEMDEQLMRKELQRSFMSIGLLVPDARERLNTERRAKSAMARRFSHRAQAVVKSVLHSRAPDLHVSGDSLASTGNPCSSTTYSRDDGPTEFAAQSSIAQVSAVVNTMTCDKPNRDATMIVSTTSEFSGRRPSLFQSPSRIVQQVRRSFRGGVSGLDKE